jgi:hypothetical protein
METNDLFHSQIEKIIKQKIKHDVSSPRKRMNDALRTYTLPMLRGMGFKGALPHLRRLYEKEIQIITFQFSVYGGNFVIELGKCVLSEEIIPENITAWMCGSRNCIGKNERLGMLSHDNDHWYSFQEKADLPETYERLAKEAAQDLENYAEEWFSSTQLPNI